MLRCAAHVALASTNARPGSDTLRGAWAEILVYRQHDTCFELGQFQGYRCFGSQRLDYGLWKILIGERAHLLVEDQAGIGQALYSWAR
jgi:hypothetical protein